MTQDGISYITMICDQNLHGLAKFAVHVCEAIGHLL